MLTTSIFVIAWLVGFLFISTGLEKSQQLNNGELTVHTEKRMAFGVGMAAYIGVSLVLAIAFVI
jgi:hypothetical protein